MPSSPRMRWLVSWLFAVALFVGCGGDSSDSTGDLTIQLELLNGTQIDEVTYAITGNDMEPMVGTINTSAPGSTASVEVYGLPAGTGYEVEMTALSTDGETSCSGSAEFDVQVGVSTGVMVVLNCKANQQYGGVRVNGKFNFCSDILKVVISPLQTSVGYDINVEVLANDEEGDPIEYQWTGTGGSFADPTAPVTTFTCQEVGVQSITITVSDDGFQYCDCDYTTFVTCVDGDGGTGGSGGGAGMGGQGGEGGMAGAGGEGGMGGQGGEGGTAGAGGMGGEGGTAGAGGMGGQGGVGGMAGAGGMGGIGGAGGMAGAGGEGGMGGGGGTGGVGGCIRDKGAQPAGMGSRSCPGTDDCGPLEVCVEGTCQDAALVFVSSQLYTADLNGPRGADKLCADLAREAGLGGYWMSWTSDECTSPQNRFHRSQIEYRLINGDRIAADWNDLIDGELDRDIRIDENGVNLTTTCIIPGENDFCWVWTNTTFNGFTHFNDGCLGLTTDVSGSAPVQSGQWVRNQPGWTQWQTKDCGQDLQAIYCFEQPESNQ